MNVTLTLTEWQITKEEKGKRQKVAGKYKINAGELVIADQSFNTGYGSVEVPFTGELLKKIAQVEEDIKAEIQGLLN